MIPAPDMKLDLAAPRGVSVYFIYRLPYHGTGSSPLPTEEQTAQSCSALHPILHHHLKNQQFNFCSGVSVRHRWRSVERDGVSWRS